MAVSKGTSADAPCKLTSEEIAAAERVARRALRGSGVRGSDLDDAVQTVLEKVLKSWVDGRAPAAAYAAWLGKREALERRRVAASRREVFCEPDTVAAAPEPELAVDDDAAKAARVRPAAGLAVRVCVNLWGSAEDRAAGARFLVETVLRVLPELEREVRRDEVEREILRYWERKAAAFEETAVEGTDREELLAQRTQALVQTAFRSAGVAVPVANGATNTIRVAKKREAASWAKRIDAAHAAVMASLTHEKK